MRMASKAQTAIICFTSSFLTAGLTTVTHAATFTAIDCDQAANRVERTICADKKLTQLDKQVAQQITAAADVSKVPQKILEATQQQWVNTRDQCQQNSCIEDSYQSRLTELKRYNLTDQHFVRHFIRVQADGSPTTALSVMEVHKLDEKRVRVIINSFAPINQTSYKVNHAAFSAYASQAKHIRIKDLDSQCLLNVHQIDDSNIKVKQKSTRCGAPHIRFSGHYQLVN